MTLGLFKENQAEKLKEARFDFYNYNIDTSKDYYDKTVTIHNFDEFKHVKLCTKGWN